MKHAASPILMFLRAIIYEINNCLELYIQFSNQSCCSERASTIFF